MSRSVLQQEMSTNTDASVVDEIRTLLVKFPVTKYSISIEVHASDGSDTEPAADFYIIARAHESDNFTCGAWKIELDLEDVPTIKEYLRATGALSTLFEELRKTYLNKIDEARNVLMGAPAEVMLGEGQ